ncbi:flagellar filament capping protein FliD [Burkholderiaceae bacterium DAT-1]|nr:flagellar filament capping protein FliD [Burkholderiaceae bacterium DAT-1]
MTTSSTGSTSSSTSSSVANTLASNLISSLSGNSSSSSGLIQAQGIGSGLDIGSIISKLMTVESLPLTMIQQRSSELVKKNLAYTAIQTAVASFEKASTAMSATSLYQNYSATVANSSLASVTATSAANINSFSLEVNSLATSQQLESGGFASANATVGTGTLNISLGTTTGTLNNGQYSGGAFTANANANTISIKIDSTNNSLTGVMNAINASNSGVKASILYDGSQYHLVMASPTGGNNSMKISALDSNGNALTSGSNLSQMAFDPTAAVGSGQNMLQNTSAANAALKINGVPVSSASNTVSNALSGVTINLLQASTGNPTTVSISQNQTAITTAAQNFVSAYNNVVSVINQYSSFDGATGTAGILNGDFSIKQVQSQISSVLNTYNGSGSYNSFATLGFNLDDQGSGQMTLDTAAFNAALSKDPKSVASVMSQAGSTSTTQLQYMNALAGVPSGSYPVNVTQLATQGSISGGAIPSTTFDKDGSGNPLSSITVPASGLSFAINVNGVNSGTINMPGGTHYSDGNALASDLQSRINADSVLQGNLASVQVSWDSGTQALKFTSNSYGTTSGIYFPSINGQYSAFANMLGLANPTRVNGVDVQGTINGLAAKGVGQVLTASSGNIQGLQVRVLGPDTGSVGSVSYSGGTMNQLSKSLQGMLSKSGIFANATNSITDQINRLKSDATDWQSRLASIKSNYEKQFTAMDTLVSKLQATGNQLTQAISSLNKSNS